MPTSVHRTAAESRAHQERFEKFLSERIKGESSLFNSFNVEVSDKEWIVSQIIKNQHKIDTTPTPLAVRPLAEVRVGRRLPRLALRRQPRLPPRLAWPLPSRPVPRRGCRSSAATAGHLSEPLLLFVCKVP